jgi:prolyl-tRNA editing enzyme YbaK/EbsC (Cys-tRNA(Pro) deacylase)
MKGSLVPTSVTELLDRCGVEYVVRKHEAPAFTSEDAARERGVRISQIAKCMVGEKVGGSLVVMIIPGDRTLKIKKVRQALGGVCVTLLATDQLEDRLGLTVGAITPMQFLELGATFVMDPSVLDEEWVDVSSGDPMAGLELRSADLHRILEPLITDIKSDPKP